jgi:hypothetical protein
MYEAFKIGVRISLVNGVSHGLMQMAREFSHVEGTVQRLQRSIRNMSGASKAAFGGTIAIGLGLSIAASLKPAIDAASKWEKAKANFSLFGMSDKQNQEAFEFAKNMNIAGSSYVENLKKMTEAQGVFRESGLTGSAALEGAKLAAPTLSKLAVLSKASGKEMSHADEMNFLRAIEETGGLHSATEFNRRADLYYRMVNSSQGNIKYEDLRAFFARGGVSALNLTDSGLSKLEPIMGSMKGTSAGTALMTAYNRLNGNIKLPNQIVHELINSGLWNGQNVKFNPHGGVANIQSKGLLAGGELLQQDPAEWYEKFVRPMYDKMGLKTQADRDNYNVKLFGRTGGMLYSQVDRNRKTLLDSEHAVAQQKGINPAYQTLMNTFDGKKQTAAASWEKILTNIGEHVLPIVNRGMDAFNKVLSGVESFTKNNPGMVKAIAVAAALFAALLVVGGVVAVVGGTLVMLGGIIGGALTAGIAAAMVVIPVVAGLLVGFWGDIKSGFTSFASYVVEIVSGMWAKVKSFLPDFLVGASKPGNAPPAATPDSAPDSPKAATPADPHVRTAADSKAGGKQGDVYLDSKKVGQVLSKQMAKDASAPGNSNTFDFTFGQASAGMAY